MGIQLPLKRGTAPPLFGPCPLWPNGWKDQDATWYRGRPRPRPHCVRWGPSSPPKGVQQPPSFWPIYCGQTVAGLSQLLLSTCYNKEVEYVLGNQRLSVLKEERDLGVIIAKSLKRSRQCTKAAAAVNAVFRMISRTFFCKDKDLILQLHESLVRPRLEYRIQAWRTFLKKDR